MTLALLTRPLLHPLQLLLLLLLPLPHPPAAFKPHATLNHELNALDAVDTPRPAVIVIQEWWGVDDQIKAHAQRIANGTGAVALVPDLYRGKLALDEAEAKHLMDDLDWPQTLADLSSLVACLRADRHSHRKVGSLGFCMGGALSLALGARMAATPRPLNACVSFYGIPPPSLIDIKQLPVTTPVQGHFGALDTLKGFSDSDTARRLESDWMDAIRSHGGVHAKGLHRLEEGVFVYEGVGHGFANELRKKGSPEFKQETVNLAWRRVFGFLTEHLKSV
ncbi:dienelactone hydrolase [Entophlyctis helioformis]|nr:dienelactone hydrolase [Entophlyctis helioformis]